MVVATQKTRQFRFRACTRCLGDAYLDQSEYEPEWRCLQCSRTLPPIAQPTFVSTGDEQGRIAA